MSGSVGSAAVVEARSRADRKWYFVSARLWIVLPLQSTSVQMDLVVMANPRKH
jgi:hypothetical protein